MLNEIRILSALEMKGLWGFNRFRHTRDKKARLKYIGMGALFALLGAMICLYVGAAVYGIAEGLRLPEIVPPLLTMLASLVIFTFGVIRAGGVIFSQKGYDMISALPVRPASIVISRFLSMYVQDLALTLAVLVPGAAVYGYLVRPGLGFYGAMTVGALFVPMLPLALSTALGALVAAVAARMRHKHIVQTLLTLVFMLAVLALSFNSDKIVEGLSVGMLLHLAESITRIIGNIYPPAEWLGRAAAGSVGHFALFAGASLAGFSATIAVVAGNFHRICRRLFTTSARHDYRLGEMKRSGMLAAMVRREAKRYFASSIYVTNTIVGPIMGCIMAAALLFSGMDALLRELPFDLDIAGLAPFLLGAVFGTMPPSSVAVSMEGREVWIAKTLPIPTHIWLDAKVLLTLIIMLPFYLIAEALMMIALRPGLTDALWLVLIPATLCVFTAVFGLTVNLRMHRFDWEKEEAVVKQSASSLLGGLGGLLLAAAGVAAALVLPAQWGNLVRAAFCAILLGLSALLHRLNRNVDMANL